MSVEGSINMRARRIQTSSSAGYLVNARDRWARWEKQVAPLSRRREKQAKRLDAQERALETEVALLEAEKRSLQKRIVKIRHRLVAVRSKLASFQYARKPSTAYPCLQCGKPLDGSVFGVVHLACVNMGEGQMHAMRSCLRVRGDCTDVCGRVHALTFWFVYEPAILSEKFSLVERDKWAERCNRLVHAAQAAIQTRQAIGIAAAVLYMTQPTSTPSLTQLEIANFLKIENWPGIENMVKILTPYADKIATFPKERMKTADLVILGIAKSAHSFLVGYWDPTINVFRPLSRVGAFTSWDNIRADALRHVTREDEHFIYTEPRIVVGVRYRRATRESLLGGFISNVRENADPKGCSKPLKIHFQKAPLL